MVASRELRSSQPEIIMLFHPELRSFSSLPCLLQPSAVKLGLAVWPYTHTYGGLPVQVPQRLQEVISLLDSHTPLWADTCWNKSRGFFDKACSCYFTAKRLCPQPKKFNVHCGVNISIMICLTGFAFPFPIRQFEIFLDPSALVTHLG